MSLAVGDRLVIKRNGVILTPDAGEAYHEFEVVDEPLAVAFHLDGAPLEDDYVWKEGDDELVQGYNIKVHVIK